MEKNKDIWVAGITRGHNGGVCLLKNGEVVFSAEEERFTRFKYDGSPLAGIRKILEYTNELDYVAFAHTQALDGRNGPELRLEWTGENVYVGMLRKFGLIKDENYNVSKPQEHSQIFDFSMDHHKLHAWCGLVRSGWQDATILVVDGAGTFFQLQHDDQGITAYEVESVYSADLSKEGVIKTEFKHLGTKEAITGSCAHINTSILDQLKEFEPDAQWDNLLTDRAGTVKAYEAVTGFLGFDFIEAGKTMGVSPYGSKNDDFPNFYDNEYKLWPITNRSWIVPKYPNGAQINDGLYIDYEKINEEWTENKFKYDYTVMQNLTYELQSQTQDAVAQMIKRAVEMTGNKKVIITGGYGLNCVANYHYLKALEGTGIEIYVEPISNDGGTALGAAYWAHYLGTGEVRNIDPTLYLGPSYNYTEDEIQNIAKKYNAVVTDNSSNEDVIDLITNKNIVTIFQGRCENGPRALGNRSILYDPTDPNGKDFVNTVKRREYFRPFAGSILKEHVHEWFDLRGMDDTPHMMYAVNCQPGIEEKIPAIIHVDGTCRIQTVTEEENKNYYDLINEFYKKTGCPIIFNTSFNLGGEPLVETLDDGFRTLANSDIEYMYLPEYNKLVYIKNTEK